MSYTAVVGFGLAKFGKYIGMGFFLSLLFISALAQSVHQHSPLPFIEEFGGRMLASDQDNYDITQGLLDNEEPPGWFAPFPSLWVLFQGFNVLGNILFLYYIYIGISYGVRWLSGYTMSPIGVILLTLLFMSCFHIIASLYLQGTPVGTTEHLRLIPLSGTVYTFYNIDAFIPPFLEGFL